MSENVHMMRTDAASKMHPNQVNGDDLSFVCIQKFSSGWVLPPASIRSSVPAGFYPRHASEVQFRLGSTPGKHRCENVYNVKPLCPVVRNVKSLCLLNFVAHSNCIVIVHSLRHSVQFLDAKATVQAKAPAGLFYPLQVGLYYPRHVHRK